MATTRKQRREAKEKAEVLQALVDCEGIAARAARALDVSERALWYRIQRHGLEEQLAVIRQNRREA